MGQILLTDEEIRELEEKERALQGGGYLEWMPPETIAKAQLKKVIEFIRGFTANAAAQAYKDDLIQALLKEIE